jgi:hypothetical protein
MRWVVVVLLSGCSSILGIDDFKLGDAGGGGEMMDGDTGYCLGPTGWRICVPTEPTMDQAFDTNLNFDTGDSPLCASVQPPSWKAAGQPDACIIVRKSFNVTASTIVAKGSRPLVLFASDSITIASQIDVASHAGQSTIGAASPSGACVAPQAAGTSTSAGGGGAGGSFMTKGGDGGAGGSSIPGRAAAANAQPPMILRGGCNGGVGGNSSAMGGVPGNGGGAIYLVAGNRIVVNGFINASGSAGRGASAPNAGGGGGGSGGMIHLHAPAISGNGGVLVANGGGAGEGADNSLLGAAGTDPIPQMPMMIPVGGNGQSIGGSGGNGFAGSTAASNGLANPTGGLAGGGGGGGGAGFIRANVAPSQVTSSPAVTIVP